MYGRKSSDLYIVAATYAVAGSCGEGSIALICDHSGRMSFGGVTFCHVFAVIAREMDQPVVGADPDQALGDRRFVDGEDGVVILDRLVLSLVIGPPEEPWRERSLRVRSPEIGVQLWPSSVDLNITFAPA